MQGKSLREEFPSVIDRAYELLQKRQLVRDIMSTEVVKIVPQASMAEAARVMGANRIGSLIVLAGGAPHGIITERDLLSRVLAPGKDPETINVMEVMSTPLQTIKPTATIKEAAQAMVARKGRLAVYQQGELVGIVTAADLIKSFPEDSETASSIDAIMTKRVVMVPATTTVYDAIQIMGDKRIGSVLVTRRQQPFGIFTERDLLTTFISRGKPLESDIGPAASSPLITIPEGTSVHQTALTMTLKHIRRLPVRSHDDAIVGIVTARDLVAAYAR
jgi:CBS domain-containing protein